MKDKKIEIRVTEQQKELLKEWSDQEGCTITEYVMRALFTKLNKEDKICDFLNAN